MPTHGPDSLNDICQSRRVPAHHPLQSTPCPREAKTHTRGSRELDTICAGVRATQRSCFGNHVFVLPCERRRLPRDCHETRIHSARPRSSTNACDTTRCDIRVNECLNTKAHGRFTESVNFEQARNPDQTRRHRHDRCEKRGFPSDTSHLPCVQDTSTHHLSCSILQRNVSIL